MKVPAAPNEQPYTPSALRSFVLQSLRWLMVTIGNCLEFFGWRPFSSFKEEDLKKDAISYCGKKLTDFGDEEIHPFLEKCLTSLRNDKDLTMFGRWFMEHQWIENVLAPRLELVDAYKNNPQYRRVPINKPLFIIGYPRSGTTIFHYLLSLDPLGYAPPLWQSAFPTPVLSHDSSKTDPRIEKVRSEMSLYFDICPLIRTMHPVDIHLPHECYHFFDRTYLDSQWHVRCMGEDSFFNFYENLHWKDVLPNYDDYKKQLQILALNHPNFSPDNEEPAHFIMKDPNPLHDYFPEAMLETFPDCNIIEMHRNPADSLKSYFLLESTVSKLLYGEKYNCVEYGKRLVETYHTRRTRIDNFKKNFLSEKGNERRYLDLLYTDYLGDPIATVKKVYEQFGYTYTQEFEDRMKWFLENNKQFKHGNYKELCAYEPFGFTREEILEQFSDYIKEYDL